jgi:hypothetical protein
MPDKEFYVWNDGVKHPPEVYSAQEILYTFNKEKVDCKNCLEQMEG